MGVKGMENQKTIMENTLKKCTGKSVGIPDTQMEALEGEGGGGDLKVHSVLRLTHFLGLGRSQ